MTIPIPSASKKITLNSITDSARLPTTLIVLDDWAIVTLTGPDTRTYLQGQVTADVNALAPDQHVLCGHCDAKGKMWSTLRLFSYNEGFAYLVRRNLRDTQLNELKKYAVFAKTTITADDNLQLIGAAGMNIRERLAEVFSTLPDTEHPVVSHRFGTLLHFNFPAERFLLVLKEEGATGLRSKLRDSVQYAESQQWLALDIESALPIIDHVNSAQFVPQATNIQALNGISFNKGCYTGQEVVARAKFRGANKRALYWLAGTSSRVPEAGENLELRMGENWRRTGTILAACLLSDGALLVQAVLSNDLAADSVLRVRDAPDSQLTLQPLPYSLSEQ
ncbi:MAG: tRNA-modifying protein YgfZ [Candidatus Malihini olakiniferum]